MGRAVRMLVSRPLLVGMVGELLIAAVDIAFGPWPILTTAYVVPVVALGLIETAPRTTVLAVIAFLLAVASGAWDHYLFAGEHVYRLTVVAVIGALSTLGAAFRGRAVRGRDGMEMLVRIGQIADGTQDREEALERLAAVLVPRAADLCELTVLRDDGGATVITRSIDAAVASRRTVAEVSPALARIAAGEAVLEPVGSTSCAPTGTESAGASIRSVLHVPVRAGERTVAVLTIGMGPSGRRLGPADLRFAVTVGTRAGLAIENARLLAEVTGARQRLEAIVGTLADGVTIRDPSGRVTYANEAALREMGMAPTEDISRHDPEALLEGWYMTDEAGEPVTLAQLPSMRLLAGEQDPEPLVVRVVKRPSGEERWRVLKTTPLLDRDGRLEAAVTVTEDITATKRAELRSTYLSRVGEVLASSLDLEQTLRNTAQLTVPEIADWCAVDLLDEAGRRHRVATAHRDPAKVALAERLRALADSEPSREQAVEGVLASGRPLLFTEIPDEALAATAPDGERRRLLTELGLRSAIVVPLRAAERSVGALTLVSAESGRVFTEDDVVFAEQIAARAAVAVENARLYSERSKVARTLQQSLLPEALPAIAGWEIASLYRPARSDAGVEVGGDFYDAFRIGDSWIVVIGDVTGKGVEAAAMTALVRYGARFTAEFRPWPVDILVQLDAYLRQRVELSLCTALCLRIDGNRVAVASAGHPLPLVITDDGVRGVGEAGPLLGAFPDSAWPLQTFELAGDETLLLFTDGVTDTVGEAGRFGDQRLAGTVAECGPLAPSELLRCLDAALSRFQSGAQADDTAALALQLADPIGTATGRRLAHRVER